MFEEEDGPCALSRTSPTTATIGNAPLNSGTTKSPLDCPTSSLIRSTGWWCRRQMRLQTMRRVLGCQRNAGTRPFRSHPHLHSAPSPPRVQRPSWEVGQKQPRTKKHHHQHFMTLSDLGSVKDRAGRQWEIVFEEHAGVPGRGRLGGFRTGVVEGRRCRRCGSRRRGFYEFWKCDLGFRN